MRKEKRLIWVLTTFVILFIPVLLLSIFLSTGFGIIYFDLFLVFVMVNVDRKNKRRHRFIVQWIVSIIIIIFGILVLLNDLAGLNIRDHF